MKWVGLEDRLDAYPSEMSGGEQQRVAIARALINRPMMILADEPTGNLDPDLALEIMNLFREINAAGTTVLVATHGRELIRQVGCRAIMLDQGAIVEETLAVGDMPTYLTPPGSTVEDEYEQSASSDTAEWGSVQEVGPLGLVEAPTVTDDAVATELHDALEGAAEQPLTQGTDGASEVVPESERWNVLETELHDADDALGGAAEQLLSPPAGGGATTEDEANKPADTDVFAALDAAFAGSEPAVPGDIGESTRKRVRRDETG